MSRRTVILGALAALAVGGTAGCSEIPGPEPTSTPTGTEERTAENPFGVDKAAPLAVAVFNPAPAPSYAEHPVGLYNAWAGGPVATLAASAAIADVLRSRLGSGTAPDVVDNSVLIGEPPPEIPAAAIPAASLLADNRLADLSILLDAPTIDDPNTKVRDYLLPGIEQLGSFGGSMRVLNYAFHLWGWWYSATLFEDNGWSPATDWDGFLELCDTIKSTGLAPIVHPGLNPDQLGIMLQTAAIKHGGNQVAVDMDNLTSESWANDNVLLAAEQFQELYDQGFLFSGSEELGTAASRAEWVQGRAAMLPSGSWLEQDLGTTVPLTFEMTVVPHPSADEDQMPYETIFGGTANGYLISATAVNKPGALEYLRVMLSQEATEEFTARTQTLAAVKGSWENLTEPSPGLESVARLTRNAGDNIVNVFSTTLPWYEPLHQALATETRRLTSGQSQADEFCVNLQDVANELRNDESVSKFERTP